MSNESLKALIRSPATYLMSLTLPGARKAEAHNLSVLPQEPAPLEIQDAWFTTPRPQADVFMGLMPPEVSAPQKRFEEVFQALLTLSGGSPDQVLELCALIREGKSLGLKVDDAWGKLKSQTVAHGPQARILSDFEKELTGAVRQQRDVPRQLVKGMDRELKSLASKGPVSAPALDSLFGRLAAEHGVESVGTAMLQAYPRLAPAVRLKFDKSALQWVAHKASDFYGRRERMQMLLEYLRPGAVLVDANQNGAVDANDWLMIEGQKKVVR